ncbi:MAG: Gldg family protein [Lewinellaceae bacterium]|nr:Gldg family protein [Lewinellaceae bacterium]
MQAATRDVLDDFRSASGYVEYEFEDPGAGTTEQINKRREQLSKDGINPVNLRVKGVEGTSEKLIYPYAIIYYKNREFTINLLENEVPGVPPEVTLNNSVGFWNTNWLMPFKSCSCPASRISSLRRVRES